MIAAALRAEASAVARQLAGRAGDVVRDRLDGLAFLWLMNRNRLPDGQALELLERLGRQLGARIELTVGPGT